jgi:hypothetical protein
MQRPDSVLVDLSGLLAAPLEDVRRPVKQRLLPLVDHRRMHAIFRGQLRHGALALHRLQRYASLEARVTIPALPHILISSSLEISRRQFVASVTVRFSGRCSDPRKELEADAFAGAAAKLLGKSVEAALSAVPILDERPSRTHPGRRDRVIAITAGWNDPEAAKACKLP